MRSSPARIALRVAIVLVALIAVVPTLVLVALQNPTVARWAAERALALADPYQGRVITVREVRGSWWRGLTLIDVRLAPLDSLPAVAIDTVRARYASLLHAARAREVDDLYVAGLAVTTRQRVNGEWDLLAPFAHGDTGAAAADTAPARAFVLSHVTVRRTSLAAYARGDGAAIDSGRPWRVSDLRVDARDVRLGSDAGARLDSVHAQVLPPARSAQPFDVALSADLTGGRLTLPSLVARAGGSELSAHATLRLPDALHPDVRDVNAVLDARPVRFADLAPLLPGLTARDSAVVHIEARGGADSVRVGATIDLARGGRITVNGTVTPRTTNVAYVLEARVSNVDPRALVAAVTEPGSVSGVLAVHVRGPSLREASGTATLELASTVRYGKWTARGVTARATLEHGHARVTMQGTVRPWHLAATATLAPFDSVRAYDIQAHIRTVGTHPAALDTATIAVALRGQRVRFAAHGAIGGGTMRAAGAAQLGKQTTWRITEGALAHVNVSRVLGDTAQSAVTGTFTANGRGTTPATLAADAHIHLAPSDYAAVRVRAADATLAMRAGTARVRTAVQLDTGTVNSDVSITLLDVHPELVVHRVAFAHLDVGRVSGDSALSTDLSGVLTARARWRAHATLPATLDGGADLTLLPSRAGTQHIDSASARITLRDGVADWSTGVYFRRGGLALAGAARPFDAQPSLAVRHGTFHGVDLGAFAGGAAVQTELNGTIDADARGLDPGAAHWGATLTLAASTVRDVSIDSARLVATLDSGLVHLVAAVHATGGQATSNVDGRLVAAHAGRPFSLGRVLAEGDLRAGVRGTWTLAAAAPDTGILPTASDTLSPPPDSLVASARLTGGRLTVDTLSVRSVVGTLTGTGAVALSSSPLGAQPAPASDLQLVLQTRDLAPLAPLLGASVLAVDSGRVVATLSGDADTPQAHITARGRKLAENGVRIDALQIDLAAPLSRKGGLAGAKGTLRATDADVGDVHASQLDLVLAFTDSTARLAASTTLDDATAASLVVTAIPDSVRSALRLDSLAVDRGRSHWVLAHPVRVDYGDRYAVNDFVLTSNTGRRIAIDGAVSRTGAEHVVAQLDSISLAPFAQALGYHALAGATLQARATLAGTARAPQLHADATVLLAGARADSGTVHAIADWTATRLDLNAALTPRDGRALTVAGYLPVRLRLSAEDSSALASVVPNGAVDLRVAAANFDVQFIQPFLNRETIDRARGSLTADARVTGTAGAPRLGGTLELRKLLLRLPALGVTYDKGSVHATLADDRLRIDTAVVYSGNGSLRLTGGVVLRQLTLGAFDVTAALRDFRAVWSDAYQVVASGQVAFTGTTKAPELTGDLTVENGTLDLSATASGGSAQPVELTAAQLRMLAARFGPDAVREGANAPTPFFDLLRLDLKVSTHRDAWVRRRANPQLQVELGGMVTVSKDPRGPLRIYGTLEPVEGRSFVAQFGRRFMVSEGQLTFNGAPERVNMDIKTQYVVPSSGDPNAAEVTIGLEVTGTPQRLRLVLSSDPQMNNSDIISYIATGRPEGEGLGIGGGAGSPSLAMQAGTSLALNQLQSVVQGLAKDKLQLDVIEIRQDGLRGATLVAGRYVSSRVYVGFAQPLGFGEATTDAINQNLYPEAQVEYGAFHWLVLRLEGGIADVRFLFRSRYAY